MFGGVICATRHPKPWTLSSSLFHVSPAHHSDRLAHTSGSGSGSGAPYFLHFGADALSRSQRRRHSSGCKHGGGSCGGAASIWHAIMPCSPGAGEGFRRGEVTVHHDHDLKGEGSWNVAWDSRPARWLHRPDSAWLLFGVCACLAPPVSPDENPKAPPVASDENSEERDLKGVDVVSANYRVTGVPADGRCLFRAIAHEACLRNGEEAPNENRQRELADELRAQVVDELLKRREETEWFIEGDFDAYVKRIQQPYVWGGEPELLMASHVLKFIEGDFDAYVNRIQQPYVWGGELELLMASHVLKTSISVLMRDTSSDDLVNDAT